MKRPILKVFIAISILLLLIISTAFIFAAPQTTNSTQSSTPLVEEDDADSIQNNAAKSLVDLGILKGYPDGSLGLKNKIKRSEFTALVIRLARYENETADSISMSFKDINKNHWAYNSFRVALKHNLITGYPDKTLKPDNNVTFAEALTILVRVLNYEKDLTGKWPDNIINISKTIELSNNVNLPNYIEVSRGEVSVLLYNSLTIDINN